MTYAARENSNYSGAPVELYLFELGSQQWAYTPNDVDYELGGRVYLSDGSIQGDVIQQTMERPREPIEIQVRRDHPIAALYNAQAADGTVFMTVFREHRGEQDFIHLGRWRVLGAEWVEGDDGTQVAKLQCEPLYTSLGAPMLRGRFSTTCRHELFEPKDPSGDGCGVDPGPWTVTATLSGVANLALQSPAFALHPDGWFNNGTLLLNNVRRRRIVSHTGDTIQLMKAFPDVAPGSVVAVRPGCDKLIDGHCLLRYNNVPNHGGYPYLPAQDTFDKAVS